MSDRERDGLDRIPLGHGIEAEPVSATWPPTNQIRGFIVWLSPTEFLRSPDGEAVVYPTLSALKATISWRL